MVVIIVGLTALLAWTEERRRATEIWVWVVTAVVSEKCVDDLAVH